MSRESTLVILNPAAGGARGEATAAEVRRCLAGHGIACEVEPTTGPGDARRMAEEAAKAGVERVIAAGGDGTIGEVAAALMHTETALGIVALGTGNAMGRETGAPLRDVPAACEAIAKGTVKPVDIGRCNDVPFTIMCGVGLDAEVAWRTESGGWKPRLGKWAFVNQFLGAVLREARREYVVTVDGEAIESEAWAVVACNGAQYTWRLAFAPEARLDDGLLHIVCFEHATRPRLLADVTAHWMSGGRSKVPNTRVLTGTHVRIEAETPTRWQADGDPRGVSPVEIVLEPGALRLVLPPGREAGP